MPSRSADETLIPSGSSWRYNDKGTNLGTAWRAASYNDSAWAQGNAQLGYGDGDEATVLGFGSSSSRRYITYYFRRTFTVADLNSISALTLRYLRDDGCVIYVNGTEVIRSNMPSGTITSSTLATSAIGNADETTWLQTALSKATLVTGQNTIAVELHQQSASSSDISFDLELRATTASTVPVVSLLSPANQSVVNSTGVTFNASATASTGLVSATLLLGSAPQTVTLSGPSQVEDAQINADTPATPNGNGASLNVDSQSPHVHALLRFPTLAASVPPGSIVNSAILRLNCTNSGNLMQAYRLTENWSENEASWNERQIGLPWSNPGADGSSSNAGVATSADCTATGLRSIDITGFTQQWTDGLPNFGIVLTDSGTDGIDFGSSESADSPALTVTYRSAPQAIETKPLSGSSANVSFATSLAIGQTYSWNVRVADSQGQQSIAPSDFGLTVDAASPNQPVLVSPANGSTTTTSPSLETSVSNPGGGSLTVTYQLRQPPAPEFTIVVMPDTQHYSESFPDIYTSQTQWIVNQKTARNIVFVTHEGDIVEHVNNNTEWVRANTSMSLLDGVVPYGMGPGNHDEPTSLYNQYFPYTRYQGLPWYGGHYQNLNDDNYQLFTAGGLDFVIVHLDFCPSAAVLAWADSIYKLYPNRIGMMTTHAYLGLNGVRNTHVCGATQYIWDGLAVPNPNLHFMFSGHVSGESRRVDTVNGHPVHQLLADYQDRASGGEGWLRLLRFVPAESKIYVQTYSPWLNRYETDADSQFTLDFPMGGAWSSLGTVSVPSGSTASLTPPALNPGQSYEWRVNVTNAAGKTVTGPSWTFTTTGGPQNQAPTANGQSVSTTQGTAKPITLTGSDPENSALTYAVLTNPANGTLSGTAPNLTYTPTASFSGQDSFTFRVNDGNLNSNTAAVSITVTPAAPVTIFSATFDGGLNSFSYLDNTFRGTTQSSYASGSRISSGGFSGGALRVLLGGSNNTTVNGMSGGFRRSFTLASAATVTLFFRYNLNIGSEYDSDEFSQIMASIDSTLLGSGSDFVAQLTGNGNGGSVQTTGWQTFQISRPLAAGNHTLTLGGYNNKKNTSSESTTILIDTVSLTR